MSYSLQNSDSFRNDFNGNQNVHETKGHNFSLIPEIGYFLSSHFMTGIKFGYHTSKNEA